MKSKIFIGHIEHTRLQPVTHRLKYPLYLYALDLDELEELDINNPLFGYNRLRPTSIFDADYLQPGPGTIRKKIETLLTDNGITKRVSSVFMITSARYFNYVFNPVSFHYCFSDTGDLIAVVAEVNNTYGERHLYVLHDRMESSNGFRARYQSDKQFHVSPFNRIEGTYDFCFSDISNSLEIQINLIKNQKKIFNARLQATGIPLTLLNHGKTLLKHPVAPHLSTPRIYLEALKLSILKKLPFFDKPVPPSKMTIRKHIPGISERLCRKLVFNAFQKITSGSLTVRMPEGNIFSFGESSSPMGAEITIRDYNFFPRLVIDGEIGLGEAYVDGEWDSPDLTELFRVFVHNRDRLSDGNFATSVLTRLKERLSHEKRKNTITNSRKNIADHYDLGNDFYQLFLDPQMLYSCAVFENGDDSLESAQINKMQAIINKAEIGPDDHVLEIGCGWGGFAIFAAKTIGCRVTGITVSKAQYNMAVDRVKQAGLDDRITILLKDYRTLKGRYDKIVSIEMVEAVGQHYLGRFFKLCFNLLKPSGIMILQSITLPDERYDRYCRERDWIQKHIFPGGHLPCIGVFRKTIRENTDFTIDHVEDIGPHYATTLRHWRDRLLNNSQKLHAQGFDHAFIRKWTYYFSICEAGFAENALHDIHLVLKRPGNA